MISIRNISKKFNGREVVKNLSLEVQDGEKIAIIGPSGCGKSTLLRLLMGLHQPDKGQIFIDNIDIASLDTRGLRQLRTQFGMLFQSGALFDSMNVEENVAFPLFETLGYKSNKETWAIVQEKLQLVEMLGAEKKMPSELSGGQRKRIGLARAIVGNPKVVLYDEPTTGLDPILSTNIEDLIVKLTHQLKVTSIVVTHQISTILRTADKIYLMHEGRLLDPETPESIQKATNIYGRFFQGKP